MVSGTTKNSQGQQKSMEQTPNDGINVESTVLEERYTFLFILCPQCPVYTVQRKELGWFLEAMYISVR